MIVVIFNLLIAIISEEYEKARETQDVIRYQEMSDMIIESMVYSVVGLKQVEDIGLITILSAARN